MSSLTSPDEAPFVFGAYASHLNEVVSPDVATEAEAVEPPLRAQVEPDRSVQPPAVSLSATR